MTVPSATSAMGREILETPDVLARFLDRERRTVTDLGARLRTLAPPVLVTCARGSSDHVAAYGKYLVEILTGTPVASVGPSVASIYSARLRLAGSAILSVSQSGKSPDIVALQASARQSGAFAIAVVNVAASPLATEADIVVPIHAGPEQSVAATKTFLASAFAIAAIAAAWSGDGSLQHAIEAFPDTLGRALRLDWSQALEALSTAQSVYVLARGPAYPIAEEAALKLKETSMLHAEAYSGAEVLHGPLQLVEAGFPVLAFRPDDASRPAMGETLSRIATMGGRIFSAESGQPGAGRLPIVPSGHPFLDSLSMLATFYVLAEAIARARGLDPDRPTSLSKVTETV